MKTTLYTNDIAHYLQCSDIIDFDNVLVAKLADKLYSESNGETDFVRKSFEYVRDRISHSADIGADEVTCTASQVLKAGHGICFAKSHLLAAILRSKRIPTGFCYQKLVLDDDADVPELIYHGLNGVFLKEYDKWIRLDARGNKEGVNAQFGIDTEQLAFPIRSDKGEQDGYIVYPEPDREIVKALTSGKTRTELWNELPMKLEYNMVCGIRKWRASDAGDLAVALSNRKVLDNLRDGLPYPYTENDAAEFIETMLSADPDSTFAFAITVDDKAIGSIGVFRQGNIHRLTAEMGYYISEEYWGNGIMTDVVLQTCDYVFSNSDIIRIYAEPFAHNAASCRVLEKAGFQFEGVLRSNAVKNGRIIDMKMYSKIKGDQQMNIISSIDSTRKGFEESFASGEFYNRQTQDSEHLKKIIQFIGIKDGMKILDLGTGSGYLAFPIAKENAGCDVVGLDIVKEALLANRVRAEKGGTDNLTFMSYDGIDLPFEDSTFDLIVTRYSLHHFPDIEHSITEISRVLKTGGRLFISDPCPNECDSERFVDDYMRLKKDGHIKFYTKDEWKDICGRNGLVFTDSFDSSIRFPKKKDTAIGYEKVLNRHSKAVIESYDLSETETELFITEQVNNIMFFKN